MTILWTEKARGDLKNIHQFISQDSQAAADAFIELLFEKTELLLNSPPYRPYGTRDSASGNKGNNPEELQSGL